MANDAFLRLFGVAGAAAYGPLFLGIKTITIRYITNHIEAPHANQRVAKVGNHAKLKEVGSAKLLDVGLAHLGLHNLWLEY